MDDENQPNRYLRKLVSAFDYRVLNIHGRDQMKQHFDRSMDMAIRSIHILPPTTSLNPITWFIGPIVGALEEMCDSP